MAVCQGKNVFVVTTAIAGKPPPTGAIVASRILRQAWDCFGGVGSGSKVCGGATCKVVTEPCADNE